MNLLWKIPKHAWSRPFGSNYNEFLFTFGDFSDWLIENKAIR